MEQYLDKVKSLSYITNAEIIDNNIIAYSEIEQKQQAERNIICDVYDAEFTKHINLIIVK